MKKILMICAMVLAGMGAFAADPKPEGGPYKETVEGIEWTFMVDANLNASVGTGSSSGTAILQLTQGAIVIPEVLGGRVVKSVGSYAFHYCSDLTSVTIPSCVKSIGENALGHCSSLTSVKIPSTVTNIGDCAFCYCHGLTSVTIPSSVTSISDGVFSNCGLTSVTISEGVKSIGREAFARTCLTSVTIPSSVVGIGGYAFSNCSRLTNVTILDGVTSIGDGAFCFCADLTSVTIPSSVASIGEFAFSGCTGLTSIMIPDGVLSLGNSAFSNCICLTNVTISSSVVSIGRYAFFECSGLTSVVISEGVKDIDEGAFSGCTGLKSVTMPSSVMSIGRESFKECTSLTRVSVPEGVMIIGGYAFKACTSLTNMTISSSVTSIGDRAFEMCDNLNAIAFEGVPPRGVGNASIKQDAAIRYNKAYEAEWLPVIQACGWTNVKAYIPDPKITDVTAQQRYPWNGKVDISYSALNIEAKAKEEGLIISLKVAAIDQNAGTTNVATTLSGDVSLADGTHKIVWDMNAQGLDIKSTNVVFIVSCESEKAQYCIVDLSAGSTATSYPVSYTNEIPGGSWSEEYKTTKLVLQRIEPGTCVVTVDTPYYVGVFQMTQRQWELVTGANPSYWPANPKRPVERVSYDMIRGSNMGAKYPSSTDVDNDSFIGKLRGRTGLHFDLPTTNQWEYACRAGTTTTYSYGDIANGDYMWYGNNALGCTHDVGTRNSNPWGMYDMHGNVYEWCLDWFPGYIGSHRVICGGSWNSSDYACASSFRWNYPPATIASTSGFRLVLSLPIAVVNFDANGGQCSEATRDYRIGKTIGMLPEATCEGAVFLGWYTEKTGGNLVTEKTIVENSTTLYAHWGWLRYMVVDISAGSTAVSYPVSYTNEIPDGSWSDECKTTKLVLQRIEPGRCVVTVNEPYYIGVFEVTQKQYERISGLRPSYFSGDKHAVEQVSYNTLRGIVDGIQSSTSGTVAPDSVIGKLQLRTGLSFDLPTIAQWEYACRAGTTTTFNYGDTPNGDYMWWGDNASYGTPDFGVHDVGTRKPNLWGIYDMHGNVSEWCLEWYDAQRINRTVRGGDWESIAIYCTSGSFWACNPDVADYRIGFRLVRLVEKGFDSDVRASVGAGNGVKELVCIGQSEAVKVDLTVGIRVAEETEHLVYSCNWVDGLKPSAVAKVLINGTTIGEFSGSGIVDWTPTTNGYYLLTHIVMTNGVQVGDSLLASFVVRRFAPKTPIISPESGSTFDASLTISMSCETEDASIHYTMDGSEPTMESPAYSKKFRIYERTVVKAIAFKEDWEPSEMAVAEYAMGRCDDPVITPKDGSEFEHSGQSVSIRRTAEDGVLRYTIDGSDPTEESPEYAGPFTIDESTVVKAKAFGDQYFDSNIVTATLTRVWVKLATPVITADETFTGTKNKVVMSCASEGATIYYTLDGSEPTTSSLVYSKPFCVTEGCAIRAKAVQYDYLDSDVAEKETTREWGIGQTMGKPDHSFETSGDAGFVRVVDETAALGESMRSGEIKNSQTSILSTVVVGPGKLSFKWKTSCEYDEELHEWDHAEFVLDGDILEMLDGETDWQSVSCDIMGDGPHTVIWRYVKDESEFEGEDCLWVSEYVWESEYITTQTTGVPVPYLWLEEKCSDVVDEFESYEKVANQKALNKRLTVEQCYVAGVDPESLAQDFTTTITMEGGFPTVTWDPDLGVLREYKVWGRESLMSGDWQYPTNSTHRFFKVTVEMK